MPRILLIATVGEVESDDAPVLFFQGEGKYWVEVVMADCQADTCLYEVQVFEKQR